MARPASLLEPVESLQATLIDWGEEQTFYRVHRDAYKGNQFNPTPQGNARFSPISDRSGKVIPTFYAGTTLDCALMETVFHNIPYKRTFKRVSLSSLEGLVHSSLTFKKRLRLIDLGTIALHKLGIKRTELIDTTATQYPRTRRWAQALYEQFPKAHGLRWTSRQDDRAHAVVLFGTRLKPADLSIASDPNPLIAEGEAILPVLDLALRLGVNLVE